MGEDSGEEKPFRYLTDAEFLALQGSERMKYLIRAQEELEKTRLRLSDQTAKHIVKTQRGD